MQHKFLAPAALALHIRLQPAGKARASIGCRRGSGKRVAIMQNA